MKVSDFVELLKDNEELRSKNIFAGQHGVLLVRIDISDEWLVKFSDDNNYGAYAVAKVKAKDLKYSSEYPDEWFDELTEQINDPKTYTHTELKPAKFKLNDWVVVIKDKPDYEKAGVKKGMVGFVVSEHAIKSKWDVIFSEKDSYRDIAEISVHEDDLELAE